MPSSADTTESYRLPVAVGHGQVSVDGITVAFVPNDSSSLLRNYLRLVRSIRRQRRAPDVALRRDDIDVLAEYLNETGEVVLDRLAALMGVTRTQRTAMLSLFASGALVIGLSTSTAASSTSTPDSAGSRRSNVPVGPDATVVEVEARSSSPGAAVVVVTTTEASQATVVSADTAVPPAVVEVAATAEAAPAISATPPAVVIAGSTSGATATTSGGQPQHDVADGISPATTEPPVVVAVEEPPTAITVSIIDSGAPPTPTAPPNVTPTTPPTTSTTTSTTPATSPGGVGEPPLDEPTPPIIDPSLVDVGAPPVPTTAQSDVTVVGP